MRLVTWNVNSVNARLERLLNFLNRWTPDIVLLQELKCTKEKYPYQAIKDLGYESYVHGQKTYNGVAILSKIPLTKTYSGFVPSDNEDPQARLIRAEYEDANLVIYSAYIPNGKEVGSESYRYKLEWLSKLGSTLSKDFEAEKNIVIGGDFNIAPTDFDVHDPKAWHEQILCSAKEREALDSLLKLGLEDCFRLHSTEQAFTWWDYRSLGFQLNKGLRIDFVFASKLIANSCEGCFIDREERKGEKASDHAPVIADFEI